MWLEIFAIFPIFHRVLLEGHIPNEIPVIIGQLTPKRQTGKFNYPTDIISVGVRRRLVHQLHAASSDCALLCHAVVRISDTGRQLLLAFHLAGGIQLLLDSRFELTTHARDEFLAHLRLRVLEYCRCVKHIVLRC